MAAQRFLKDKSYTAEEHPFHSTSDIAIRAQMGGLYVLAILTSTTHKVVKFAFIYCIATPYL